MNLRLALRDPAMEAAHLAAQLAQEMRLPPGNLWEPPAARALGELYAKWGDWAKVEAFYRKALGFSEPEDRDE